MSEELKRQAAATALEFVTDGMKLGIGTGSTAVHFIELLGEKVAAGLSVIGVPTSEATAELCTKVGVPLTTLDETPELDLTIDGADEIDPQLRLIKGGGGALLREKIVASASSSMIVIADGTKVVDALGKFPLPIEVMPFGLGATRVALENVCARFGLKGDLVQRKKPDGSNFVTDGQHFIIDATFGRISDVDGLDMALRAIPGVVETGLFVGIATKAVVAGANGITILDPQV
ncbi:ribose-5-phosphate isomerase [Cohaesibacter sp. ES.047]|uniref:ribose-5-phosphate isomerase RpiA n=1 Tax=Cohaesibacter sp. ES.047 TaxID=1798205 RepID=UPI000BB99A7A|nr:ribose-5-phosphate isomerase RpiA [Cohaesibacter sp. ES.047]SNY93042.1 ribose-5-phosphate isomerase [Cohaesibacter sp. ES.047]